jgi:hypothetical protein
VLVDTLGLIWGLMVIPADVQDRDAAKTLLAKVNDEIARRLATFGHRKCSAALLVGKRVTKVAAKQGVADKRNNFCALRVRFVPIITSYGLETTVGPDGAWHCHMACQPGA